MILGIESSCDDSGLAVFCPQRGIVSEKVHRQLTHSEYGGVVPALASREHLENFTPLLEDLKKEVDLAQIQQIAVTHGPGLAGCLALGIGLGKALSIAIGKPLVGVNHLKGHAFSPFIPRHGEDLAPLFPHLGLLVSGGNTLLFEIGADLKIQMLAQTVDDAAGEGLDKGAKLLGMRYPGGALIEKRAAGGDSAKYDFPRAFPSKSEMKFSFSGLKTSLRYMLEKLSDAELDAAMPDICASYQEAVVDALIKKTTQAAKLKKYESFGLSGGVANNGVLRSAFEALAKKQGAPALIAEPRHTGDNATMIAFAAHMDPEGVVPSSGQDLSFDPGLPLC